MKKADIIAAIEAKVSNYSVWRIGLTHDTAKRKEEWEDELDKKITTWFDWQADSLSEAQDVENHFIKKGMKGGTGGDLSSDKTVYVYIFI